MYIKATDDNIRKIISDGIKNYGPKADLNYIDTSDVTSMSGLFYCNHIFRGDISGWDVHNVTDMSWMFADSHFNGDISRWNVSCVKNMAYMFEYSTFNRKLSGWDVHNVENMQYMFFKSHFNRN